MMKTNFMSSNRAILKRWTSTTTFLVVICLSFILACCSDNKSDDKKLIERAILNYVEAFYEADTSKAYESVARDISKRGYYISDGIVVEAKMSFQELIDLAQEWKYSENINPSSPKKITIFDILDKTASAKVEAKWGIDYFHLAKKDGKWIIMNVLWQEYSNVEK